MSDEALGSSVEATREPSFLLAAPERRLLRWLAGRLPTRILPDDLTALGVIAAFGVAVAYQLANDSLAWLWVASGSGSATRSTARWRGSAAPSARATATTSITSRTPSRPR